MISIHLPAHKAAWHFAYEIIIERLSGEIRKFLVASHFEI